MSTYLIMTISFYIFSLVDPKRYHPVPISSDTVTCS